MRRLVIVLLVLVAPVVVVAVAVQAVLVSDLPRRVVVAQLQEALGLEVEIDRLRARWSGHAEAEGIRVSLPLDQDPFLEASVLRLKHTALLRIVLLRSVNVDSLFIEEPVVHLVQRQDGVWNLQQVQEVLAANLAGDPDAPRDPIGPLPLPELELRNARLVLDRLEHDVVELEGVRITGERRPPLAYVLDVDIPRVGDVSARFSRAAPFSHEVSFDFAPERALVDDLIGEPTNSRLAGVWRGRVTSDEVRGTLHLSEASIAAARLSGSAQLLGRTDTPTIVLEPTSLAMSLDHPAMPEPVYMVGGRLLVTETDVQLQDVRFTGFDGRALVRGQIDLQTLTGELGATWDRLAFPNGVTHGGELDVQLSRRGPARRVVQATVGTRGHSEFGDWDGVIELNASGETYADLLGTIRSREMRYELRGERYRLAELTAGFATDERSVRLTQFELGEPGAATRLAGDGVFDWVDGEWSAEFVGESLPLPAPAPPVSRLRLVVGGDAERAELRQVEVETLGMALEASGFYAFAEPEPLQATLRLRQMPIHLGDNGLPLVEASNVVGELVARGTVQPLNVRAEGRLLAEGLKVHHDELGDIELQVRARADEEAAAFELDAVEWLGGQWQVRAMYGMDERRARVFVDAADVDLTLADGLVDPALDVEVGRMDVSLEAEDIERGLNRMRVDGEFMVRDLARAPLAAERVTGRLVLRHGRASVRDLLLEQGDGRVRGEVMVDLAQPSRLRFGLSFDDWPVQAVPHGRLNAWVNGRVRGEVDAAQQVGDASVELALDLASAGLAIGQVQLDAGLDGTMLRLHSLSGQTLEGTIGGEGQVDLHDIWNTARLDVRWDDLQPQALELWLPVLRRMSGSLSGSITVAPTHSGRALGPLQLELVSSASEARLQDLPIGDGRATVYIDRDRLVLQNLMFEAMGGQIGAWGRVSDHRGEQFVFASGWLTDLDMEMISETLRPDEAPLLGRLSADVSLSTPVHDWQNVFGTGSVTLRDSDIGTIPLISVLYDVLNIALIGREPEGRGQGTFRFEEGTVLIERFLYHNRGAAIRLSGRAMDMWEGLDSRFRGVASLSLAPLPDVEVLEVLNEAFTALQADATTVRLTGRINNPDTPQVVPFRGVFDAVRRVLGIRETPHQRQAD
ncbi:hypothetical protein ACERK3_05280 [Phycisphaerales bacterium AB-hyl4]|uniref:AsmA-like C-terminal domain-containing protein n=1 Tax=Natronomicrosphaera hydrolytica TaxID=3242702 RepID=A0ABV4U4E2_9BACT